MKDLDTFALILVMLIPTSNALICTCNCGPSSYTPSASCTTSAQCSEICYWGYSSCYKVNTQGCCGTLGCSWYSGDTVYSEAGTCICSCASSFGGSASTYEQGRANSSSCSTSTCRRACQYLYPSTCGTYTNAAYCADNGAHHQSGTFLLSFFTIMLVYFTQT